MKINHLLLFLFFSVLSYAQPFRSYKQVKEGVEITLATGILKICPVSDNAVRIKFYKEVETSLPELIFTEPVSLPGFKITEDASKLEVKLKNLTVVLEKQTGKLSYSEPSGKTFLSEMAGTRRLTAGSVLGEPCVEAEQSFESPSEEYIYGLGQFQDGHSNIKGVSRRLSQVNSQISIPFFYSNQGYGLLWHQYGLTDFNPADNSIPLQKQEQTGGNSQMAEVTTTSGTQKVAQNQLLYTGKFNVSCDGVYSLFLDLDDMGNRHFVVIDGKTCVDQSNMWLPPTVGFFVNLKAGEHQVQVICKSDNHPKLSWRLTDNTTTFRSPNAKLLDYVVFYGPSADKVIATYRKLSGNAPMLPKWAFGFWQCRERYTSGTHLVETVKEFRKRNLPMDVIVQDWQYWGSKGWGVPVFDEARYPNPEGFIKEIHDLNAHFNISIWSNPDKNSTIGKEFVNRNLFIPDTKWLDYYNPTTRESYWNVLNENLFSKGVDSWWMDATEPENDALKGVKTYAGAGDFYRLTYPLMVSKTVYEGQRSISASKRVCILTRSAFSGQQRYGIINWSGDIGGTWESYKRQIVAGLNYCISGLPYWTTDIGGFFRPGNSQYTDEKYQELLTRWFQWGTFNPIFRIHGYMTETEPWKFGPTVEENMRKMLNLRYRLLPYIYSEAWQVTKNGSTMMRPLAMDFNGDTAALNHPFQFMFGKSVMVAPVTEPGVNDWNVYLPKLATWYDFYTGTSYQGGHTIKSDAPLDKIPLFVKAGTIIPLGKPMQYAGEKQADTLEIRIYDGANGGFTLYEDEGDSYNYEKGCYSTISFKWDNIARTLTIGKCMGSFPGMLAERKFKIVLVTNNTAELTSVESFCKEIHYLGKEIVTRVKRP